MSSKPVNMTVVTNYEGDQCLYVEGKRWEDIGEISVYACDLEHEAKGRPIILSIAECEEYDDWPMKLEDVELKQ